MRLNDKLTGAVVVGVVLGLLLLCFPSFVVWWWLLT